LSQIIQQAQEQIAINANGILGRLSNGLWQVDLRNGRENELHIEARDLMTGQTRPFKCLSGGEKFRVAVSLAVAIGQYVLGGRSVDTLIIDEGFGALDETNRDLLVKELSNLSEEVLSGGRVIVVSHQEDVCDRFGSRYRIEKEADGYIKVRSGRTE
jgi:DNA repair protein SbcC/Rad50